MVILHQDLTIKCATMIRNKTKSITIGSKTLMYSPMQQKTKQSLNRQLNKRKYLNDQTSNGSDTRCLVAIQTNSNFPAKRFATNTYLDLTGKSSSFIAYYVSTKDHSIHISISRCYKSLVVLIPKKG